MQFRKGRHELSVLEAIDNLSQMAELDVAPADAQGELTEEQVAEHMHARSWHNSEYYAFHREQIKETFLTLLKHMKDVYEKGKGHLREDLTQRGFQAMMLLVNEAAQKIDAFTSVFKGDKEASSVTELKEFKELQQFYQTRVFQRFQKIIEFEEPWQEEWGGAEGTHLAPIGLKDLDAVRRDREYELFQIQQEEGTPYFTRTLLRHMQLMGQFDALLADPTLMENPLLRIPAILDREAHLAAKEILHAAGPHIDAFYKEALKFKHVPLIAALNKGVMALMLAGNSRNLMQSAAHKYALHYYADFHAYLRSALAAPEYHKFISNSLSFSESFLHCAMHLAHVLCTSFFLKTSACKEKVDFIHMLIEKGQEGSTLEPQVSALCTWNNLHDQDESIRSLLRQYPSGPLMKTLRLFQDNAQMQGFDPIAQLSSPSQLYTLSGKDFHVSCIQIPSPTWQLNIDRAEVVSEFCGFLRSFASAQKNQRHLLINLQDRTSWLSHARCIALERMEQESREFASSLRVVTLPKTTEFYFQSGSYREWDDAAEFMKLLQEQLKSGEQCGFYFPPQIDQKQLLKFTSEAMKVIHTLFFAGKERLVLKNRLDFIEIFYQMLTLKLIEEFQPDTLSFTCKDTVDIGPAAGAELFAFVRLMNAPSAFTKQEQDFLLWLLYSPALSMRERALDSYRLSRMLSALGIVHAELEAHFTQTVAACAKLYKVAFFQGAKVEPVSLN